MMILLISIASIIVAFITILLVIHLAPARAVELALNATRRQSHLTCKQMTLSNGLSYSYLEGGQGDTLMLLHGFGGNKDTFTRVSRYLVKHYRVIIPDIIGFGESTHLDQADYLPAAQVERLRAFMQAMNIQQVHLGGNSMGAQIALVYAAKYPSEALSLWLLSPLVSKDSFHATILTTLSETGKNPLIATNVNEFINVMARGMYKPPYIPRPMLAVLAQENIQNAELEKKIFEQIQGHSIANQLNGLVTPTLIVFGMQDRVIAIETADWLNKKLSDTKIVLVKQAGHVPMFEKPRQCASDYLTFRESLVKRD